MLKNKTILIICLLLTIAVIIVFWRVSYCDFNNYDDPYYVTNNTAIRNGITLDGLRWAFTTDTAANWHPLTWISHMLDVQLFGVNPRWHHLVNLLFHLANSLLLFIVLHRMTKAHWESAVVAALFALHPLHVESVAWVAERKDVLSTFFWILTMGAYSSYSKRQGARSYLFVVLFLLLGLLAKPMLVTLPFVLLLLDYWPLERFKQKADQKNRTALSMHGYGEEPKAEEPAESGYQWALIRPLLWEKIPLVALAAASSIVTFIFQQKGGAVASFERYTLGGRISNAFVSYIAYIEKTLWPDGLAVFYPYQQMLPAWQVLGAVILLIAATVTVIWKARRIPYMAMGWLWYVGTLVPVIGIVQVGAQARADRYTYIPLIGLFIMAAWGISELSKKWRYRKEALVASSTVILLCLSVVTWTQVGYWRNSITLFEHALTVTDNNDTAYNNRGIAYWHLGNYQQAIGDYDKALKVNPKYAIAYYNRGLAYASLGNDGQAIGDYDKALELDPNYAEAYYSRGTAYWNLGNDRQAIGDYDKAIELDPGNATAYNNRGNSYFRLGNFKQAIGDYDKAIENDPKYAAAYNNRGIAYANLRNDVQALKDLRTAARLGENSAQKLLRSQGINW